MQRAVQRTRFVPAFTIVARGICELCARPVYTPQLMHLHAKHNDIQSSYLRSWKTYKHRKTDKNTLEKMEYFCVNGSSDISHEFATFRKSRTPQRDPNN